MIAARRNRATFCCLRPFRSVYSPSDLLTFWGKAQAPADAEIAWHPLVYHLLDVAASAEAILRARPLSRAKAAALLRLDEERAEKLLVALVALHDLGKFGRSFQAKRPDRWPPCLGPFAPSGLASTAHTTDGFELWNAVLAGTLSERLWVNGGVGLRWLARATFGHHGRPIVSGRKPPLSQLFGAPNAAAAVACGDLLLDLLGVKPVEEPSDENALCLASWWVAGFTTLADWVGSRVEWFPYRAPDVGLADYWPVARALAKKAVRRAGLATPTAAPERTFGELTGFKRLPTPMQVWTERAQLPEGPVLVIIEDATGSGKTEAAQMLVHRFLRAGRAAGAYWAMPTQATANAMFERQHQAIAALFVGGRQSRPSIALSHGKARLNNKFRALVMWQGQLALDSEDWAANEDEIDAGPLSSAFLADDRRAGMLADVGVGTVDQALLSVLPSKFNTVRLLGLAEKVLVIDEAHAYDAYMRVELEELLRFQAALGGSCVVLSATLPSATRRKLISAWRDNTHSIRYSESPATIDLRYPLVTVASREGFVASSDVSASLELCRQSVSVRWRHEIEDVVDLIVEAQARGAAVAWIRNTVDGCLTAASAISARGIEPLVFHARFAQCDRQERETEVLRRFGPVSQGVERQRVLVATQVIEQSLDLDFDILISDLAPIDLLIQRAGRLWRHGERERPNGLRCELVVLAPPWDENPPANWLHGLLPWTDRVYSNPAILWRTFEVLRRSGVIRAPDDLRLFVEEVYSRDDCPDALRPFADEAIGRERGDAAIANIAVLKVLDGYHGDAQPWVSDLRAQTRLSDGRRLVRLAQINGTRTRLIPWAGDESPLWRAWAQSEVSLSLRRVPLDAEVAEGVGHLVAAAKKDWGRFEDEILMLPLEPVTGSTSAEWMGELVRRDSQTPIRVLYSRHRGLVFV